jgi:hypothetical protein
MDFEIMPSWDVNVTVSSTDLGQNPNLYYDVSTDQAAENSQGL